MATPSASPVSSAIPPAVVKPRKPYEWTFLLRGKRKLAHLGVFSENKTEDLKWWLSSEPTRSEKKKRSSGSGKAEEGEKSDTQDEASSPAAPAAEAAAPGKPQLYLHVKEGDSEEVYPLTEEEAKQYEKFASEFSGNRGIHIIRAVRGSKVVGLPNKSKYWLSPRRTTESILPGEPKAGQNIAAYKLFQQKLETDNLVLVCHWVHGKGFSPVLIMASEDGLVMVQVPLLSQFHNAGDAIDAAWKEVKTTPQLRERFAEFFETLLSPELHAGDFEHPERIFLRDLVIQKREAGAAKSDSEMFMEPAFDDALQAMIEEAGASLAIEPPPKPARKKATKPTDGSGGAAVAQKPAKAKSANPKSANPKKPR